MSGESEADPLWIIGAGRAGLALGLSLVRSGWSQSLVVSGRGAAPPDHPLFDAPLDVVRYEARLPRAGDALGAAVIAVPDAAVAGVAAALAASRAREGSVGLHLSGALGLDVLAPIRDAGWRTGALHPLVAIPLGEAGAAALRDAWWGVEASGDARECVDRILRRLGGRVLTVGSGAKPSYHAAAVLASNYVVTLLGVAERLMAEAGADPESARSALTALARGAVASVEEAGPAAALTGPISRGDSETVRLHIQRLSGQDRRLYSALAAAALELARTRRPDADGYVEIARILEEQG
jgi:predicted short-subunit dehydrogenase-like oxidoreductase (DUF2520 family)